MNKKVLHELFDGYISKFDIFNMPPPGDDENYKWEAVANFQRIFDLDARDFHKVLLDAEEVSVNLVDSFIRPFDGLVRMAEDHEDAETIRGMFRDLFEADKEDLAGQQRRIDEFLRQCDILLEKHYPGSYMFKNDQRSAIHLFRLRSLFARLRRGAGAVITASPLKRLCGNDEQAWVSILHQLYGKFLANMKKEFISMKGYATINIKYDKAGCNLTIYNHFVKMHPIVFQNLVSVFRRKVDYKMETVLIISALEKEILPVLEAIDSPLKGQSRIEVIGDRVYHIFSISDSLTIICASFLGMGQRNASIAIREAAENYGVSKVILTGICTGIDKKMQYGDIIISDQVVDYELEKIKDDTVQVRWNVYRNDYELVQSMMEYKSDQWFTLLKKMCSLETVKKPNVYSGIVLSGNKVIANNEQVKRFIDSWDKASAIETEAAGIAATMHMMNNPPSFVMVKAICDFADSSRNYNWQENAAYASAIFALSYVFTECGSWTKKSKPRPKQAEVHLNNYKNQKIVSVMRGTYNLSEINVLAFNLGIDIEEIQGSNKSEKIVELVKYCQRRDLVEQLVARINEERDNMLAELAETKYQSTKRVFPKAAANTKHVDVVEIEHKNNEHDHSQNIVNHDISFADELAAVAFQKGKAEAMT